MLIYYSIVKRKGKVSINRKLAESYRDPVTKKPRVRTVQKIEKLPISVWARIIYENNGQKHLTSEEWVVLNELELLTKNNKPKFEVGDLYQGAGSAVALKHLRESGLFKVLDKNLTRNVSQILRELVINQLLYPKSMLKFIQQR